MSVAYKGVLWNRQKQVYDTVLWALILLYIALFTFFNIKFFPTITVETIIIRATGTLALLLLHVILSIGPLARIDKRFLILLYNRRHLGVSMFLIALTHGTFNLIQFHSRGNVNPFVSLFTSNTHYGSFINFPFQVLGFFALIILLLMAATSHDFWLKNLSPRAWKSLHMMVYVAYALVIMHVMLGVMELEQNFTMLLVLLFGMLWLTCLHLYSGYLETKKDSAVQQLNADGFLLVCKAEEIPLNRAKIISVNGERIAVFKYDGKLSAVSNVCKHQNGPLGEGKIVDGCITCPWHGYQYQPHDGCSPPPFKEKVATYRLKLLAGSIYIDPKANGEGVYEEPVLIT
ncbi:MAG TPA: ferric reductase-like transmembrane domain-containing protein [Chitinophagales bacterium]|nr:ferric reductase-like transmembrane domain-containing protein [Chitinophagales bacterium]